MIQQLKLKRIRRKKDIANKKLKYENSYLLNFHLIKMYKDKITKRVFFHNTMTNKWYELINEVTGVFEGEE